MDDISVTKFDHTHHTKFKECFMRWEMHKLQISVSVVTMQEFDNYTKMTKISSFVTGQWLRLKLKPTASPICRIEPN